MKTDFSVSLGEQPQTVSLLSKNNGTYALDLGDEELLLDAVQVGEREYHVLVGDRSHNVLVEGEPPNFTVHIDGRAVPVHLLDERQAARMAALGSGPARGADGTVPVNAPMPGKVVKVLCAEGEAVDAGQGVVVVEAMKMENELKSPVEGTVKQVLVAEGQNVEAGEALLVLE